MKSANTICIKALERRPIAILPCEHFQNVFIRHWKEENKISILISIKMHVIRFRYHKSVRIQKGKPLKAS